MRTLCADLGLGSITFRVLLVSALLMGASGCSTLHRVISPSSTTTTPGGMTLTQTGDAAKPASVSTTTEAKTVPLPAGTNIVFDEKLNTVTLQLSQPTTLKTETKTEVATAPQAFTPPAPPTPVQVAAGRAQAWFWVGLVVGVAVGLFGLVRDWDFVMYGGGAVAGACAFAIFVEAHPLVFVVIGIGVALKFAGPYFWHMYVKPTAAPAPPTTP